ncbi:MAG: 4-hydroxybutyrate CoA-transferase [Alphaproteobacteria bacterium]|nr:4-hydroxybutyrate CoA-transferase [Alphaproteobacteria bacterium]MDX5369746.1 4-hydroxybutyrate CoA-transferase [Alphaproteobacteria bacterium]MDX5464370.1 4-hydroxybutyrate CoA-transferase [Alphaproteobacteria bacterium]
MTVRIAGSIPALSEEEIVGLLRDDMLICINGGTGLPNRFLQILAKHAHRFRGIRLAHPMRQEQFPVEPEIMGPEFAENIYHISDFSYDRPVIDAIRDGRASYRPLHPHHAGADFPYDIDLLVSATAPMDRHGFFGLGAFGGWIVDFLPKAKRVLFETSPHQPRTHGTCYLPASRVDFVLETDDPVKAISMSGEAPTPDEAAMARHIAGLVEDGATLQVGVGKVPDAVVRQLAKGGQKDLGVHSEALFDWAVDLWEAGVITNARKTLHPGKMISAVAIGSKRLYDFVDDNPAVEFHPISYTNDPAVIARNNRQVSINATIQMDLFGQCASETVGPQHYSGVGGQWAFHYGASVAPGGIGVIMLPSTGKGGTISRIQPVLPTGSVVSITRNDIHYVCTEQGITCLRGLTMADRALRIIGLAHPDFREDLMRAARDELRLIPRTLHPARTAPAPA